MVIVGDHRKADIYALFDAAPSEPDGAKLLVRASHNRLLGEGNGRVWENVRKQIASGIQEIQVPLQEKCEARVAELEIRFARIKLKPPPGKNGLEPLTLWTVQAQEIHCADDDKEPLKWVLLTTIEVTLLSGPHKNSPGMPVVAALKYVIAHTRVVVKQKCQPGNADHLEVRLAIDMVVAWRIYHLSKLGRQVPTVPCPIFFNDAQ